MPWVGALLALMLASAASGRTLQEHIGNTTMRQAYGHVLVKFLADHSANDVYIERFE
jgi:hypothetical protein